MKLVAIALCICAVLALVGCAPHRAQAKPMLTFPSAIEVENVRLTKENQELQIELSELTSNCSAVLRIFKEADLNARKPAAKEK